MLPESATRVENATAPHIRQTISRDTARDVEFYADNPELIGGRLRELDREWDVERILQTQFAITAITGMTLAETVDRRWRLLAWVTMGFFLQHALQGWCPPLALWRRIGARTAREIERERCALERIRGSARKTC